MLYGFIQYDWLPRENEIHYLSESHNWKWNKPPSLLINSSDTKYTTMSIYREPIRKYFEKVEMPLLERKLENCKVGFFIWFFLSLISKPAFQTNFSVKIYSPLEEKIDGTYQVRPNFLNSIFYEFVSLWRHTNSIFNSFISINWAMLNSK